MPPPKPALISRWVYSGPDLRIEVTSTSTSKSWKAFNVGEHARLDQAWQALPQAERNIALQQDPRNDAEDALDPGNPDDASQSESPSDGSVTDADDLVLNVEADKLLRIVPVGPDSLFTVDLASLKLVPAFWKGPSLRVQKGEWFFPSSKPDRFFPCDPFLALALEQAYDVIQPWSASYSEELRSAHRHGVEAEDKLRVQCNERWDVIFSGSTHARLFNRGLSAKLSKSFLSTILPRGAEVSGTLVVRGYDTAVSWKDRQKASFSKQSARMHDKRPPTDVPAPGPPQARTAQLARDAKLRGEAAAKPVLSTIRRSSHKSAQATFQANDSRASDRDQAPSSTAEFMEDYESEHDFGPPEVLVLVVHGIGQQLAETWDSFSFVHAVNDMRLGCQNEAKSGFISSLLRGKRAQFIPILWRNRLQFESKTTAPEPYTLDDIQVKGSVPLIRSVVKGVVLDVPYYMADRESFINAVVRQCNRVYRLFVSRNPAFTQAGTVSIVAHSLGSVLIADILSRQPTRVRSVADPDASELKSLPHLCFNTDQVFFLGSPAAFFLHLRGSNLIPRKGAHRTKGVASGVAADMGYGCLALNTLYSVYAKNDIVAYLLNATVDAHYARLLGRSLSVPKAVNTLEQMLDLSSGKDRLKSKGQFAKTDDGPQRREGRADTQLQHTRSSEGEAVSHDSHDSPADGRKFDQAKARMRCLNPTGCIDFELPPTSTLVNEYWDAAWSHSCYWSARELHQFLLIALFGGDELLYRLGEALAHRA